LALAFNIQKIEKKISTENTVPKDV
jgi:hypothetical protein